MKSLHTKDFKVNDSFSIAGSPTTLNNKASDDDKKDALKDISKKLGELQDKMYANNRYGVLIVLQGMDTSGKDSLIREVFKNFNARGVNVFSFKQPTSAELEHDYLWRHYIALPDRGKFAVFNRSHYENVLVTRVHPEYILNENLPGIEKVEDIPATIWEDRYKQINNFEKHLAQNGTIILKFFLNISKEEQRQRLLRRLDLKKHNWKFAPGDLTERNYWKDYQKYYEEAINNTSKEHAPWYVIPADDKKMARLLVAKTILDELEKYDIKEPEVNEEVTENINKYIEILNNEK
ncbi:phosphate:nucleotide phosphotransferase [Flavobacterium rivuli WB 3.3-2 = DSM 21788]|uniref:Phosphate:nucleotide phosphotransferase n=1 Tax=Flavobacterium rivuli WB 3.3-2 = DSM 21788 TaxID=1121895 RepID=A0A0A2M1K6_9FLAO|nr:PPK2 family polyphosphate kinase [Flavobacterium rivuli]KGO85501.1 phosphate:nucleotide phosphotransferase [Flavobacterium rivuli WB 3.3-2 = DSM 21788]